MKKKSTHDPFFSSPPNFYLTFFKSLKTKQKLDKKSHTFPFKRVYIEAIYFDYSLEWHFSLIFHKLCIGHWRLDEILNMWVENLNFFFTGESPSGTN